MIICLVGDVVATPIPLSLVTWIISVCMVGYIRYLYSCLETPSGGLPALVTWVENWGY